MWLPTLLIGQVSEATLQASSRVAARSSTHPLHSTMRSRALAVLTGITTVAFAACGGSSVPADAALLAEDEAVPPNLVPVDGATLPQAPPPRAPAAPKGTATVSLQGEGISVSGEFPATLCGNFFMLGAGMAYQTEAGEWQIAIGSEDRQLGDIPLKHPDGSVNVVVVVNGPGRNFIHGPRNSGSFRVHDEFRRAEADLELRNLDGTETPRLVATFVCD